MLKIVFHLIFKKEKPQIYNKYLQQHYKTFTQKGVLSIKRNPKQKQKDWQKNKIMYIETV